MKANLFVHKDRSCYRAMLNLAEAMSIADYRTTPDGIYVPLSVYLQWADTNQEKPASAVSDEELRSIYAPGSPASERMRKSHLLRDLT